MSLLNIPDYTASGESDVEQKFVFPLLTHPSFLAIPARSILTKKSMGVLSFVQKTSLPRNYVPDYVVFFHGLPICVVEAKAADVAVRQAIDEARLYADTLNKQFPTRFNPIELVVGCNGREIEVGPVDSNSSEKFTADELLIGSAKLRELRAKMGAEKLLSIAEGLKRRVKTNTYLKPAQLLNQQLLLDRIKPNELAAYLTPLPIRLTHTPTRASVGRHGRDGHPRARRSGFSPVAP